MLGDGQREIDKHVLAKVFRICHTRKKEVDQVEMSNARVALANIIDRVPNIYNINGGCIVKNTRLEYVNGIVIILLIIYQKDKVKYCSNKSTMIIFSAIHGEYVNWVVIMSLLEICHFATVVCNWFSVACDTCNCKFAQLRKTSCMRPAVACDNTYMTSIYSWVIWFHPPILYTSS